VSSLQKDLELEGEKAAPLWEVQISLLRHTQKTKEDKMIELLRYARLKPEGVVSAQVTPNGTIQVEFKRFSVENGKEIEPEQCAITFEELETRLDEARKELGVIEELLALKPK
jgi:uncharacterized radical SAM superfamily protein